MEKMEKFKQRILSRIENIDIDFEVGYCWKHMMETYNVKTNKYDLYWSSCYFFLKGLAHFYNIKTFR